MSAALLAPAVDFFSYNTNGTMYMGRDDFVRYMGDSYPGMFSRGFVELLFFEGARTPARVDRGIATESEGGEPPADAPAGGSLPEEGPENRDEDGGNDDDGGGEPSESGTGQPQAASPADAKPRRANKRVLPLVPDRWNVQQFISHLMAVSENVLV